MKRSAFPGKKGGWSDECAQKIQVRERSCENHGNQDGAWNFWEKPALEGEGGQAVCERIHEVVYLEFE